MSGSEFGRFAGWRAVDDLGVDLDDATEAPLLHPGSTARASSTGLLTKNSSCATWSSQATSASGASGCGPWR